MTISDANPIQFWPVSEETFNEKEVCSINSACFCQPWQCDDNIHIQYQDSTTYNAAIKVYSSLDALLATIPMSRIAMEAGNVVYDVDFALSELGICSLETLIAPSSWVNGAQPFGSKGAIAFQKLNAISGVLYSAYQPLIVAQNSTVTISFNVVISNNWTGGAHIAVARFYLADGSGTQVSDLSFDPSSIMTTNGSYDIIATITATAAATRLYVDFSGSFSGGTLDATITITPGDVVANQIQQVELQIWNTTGNTELAKSDCLNVKTTQDCTELIEYSNSNDFDDIDYSDTSPSRIFYLRVPAIFFEESFPDISESIDLSDSETVQLVSEVKAKKMLEVGFVPFYFVRKLQLVLAHDNVVIQGKNWTKLDGYQPSSRNRHYPLLKCNFLLTDRDFVKRNVL